MNKPNNVTGGFDATVCSTAIVDEIIAKLRCEYADAVVSRDELERNGISHGASWWDGVLKGLNIAKRVIEESRDGKHTD
jgi:hypothetical protein